MNILYMSDFYLNDKKLLESIGKAIKFSGESFVIIPDGRRFSNPEQPLDILQKELITDQKIIQNIERDIYGVIGKRMISFFSEAPVASIAAMAEMKSMVTFFHETVSINKSLVQSFINTKTNLILIPALPNKHLYVSPIHFLNIFHHLETKCFILDENIPPDGISTFNEMKMWVDSEPEKLSNYFWLNEWPDGLPLHFINLLKLKEFTTGQNRILKITK